MVPVLVRVNCQPPPASATLVDTFCHAPDARSADAWTMLVESGRPRKKSVNVWSGCAMRFVMIAGGNDSGSPKTVPTDPGPPLKVVPNKESPNNNNPPTGNAPSTLVPLNGSVAVK